MVGSIKYHARTGRLPINLSFVLDSSSKDIFPPFCCYLKRYPIVMRRIVMLLFVYSVYSCVDSSGSLQIELDPPQIAVEGVLVDGLTPNIFVGKTAELIDQNLNHRIDSASISISVFEDGRQLFTYEENATINLGQPEAVPRTNQRYSADTVYDLRQGAVYELLVVADGLPNLRSPPIVYTPLLTEENVTVEVSVDRDGANCRVRSLTIFVANADPESVAIWAETYLVSQAEDERQIFGESLLQSLVPYNGGQRLVMIMPEYVNLDCNFLEDEFRVLLIAASTDYANFEHARTTSLLDIGGVFSTNAALPHNVIGGFGYFGLGSSYLIDSYDL